LARLRVAEPRPLKLHARIGKHVAAEVEAERASGAGREQLEHAPGAGAEIDEEREGSSAKRLVNRSFDLAFGDMQRSDLVPLAGMLAEIALRRILPRFLDGRGARAVAGEHRVCGIEARDDSRSKCCFAAAIGEAEEHPASFTEARDQPRFGHQLQMSADARLALSQDLRQILDVELGPGKQRQDAKPRGLAGAAKAAERLGTGEAPRGRLVLLIT
jgi:hypothetical protein